MPSISGAIKKLRGYVNSPIEYHFPIGDQTIYLNDLLGKTISISYSNKIYCIQCQRNTSKSFQQGYCYPCYVKLLDCNLCMIHPEKCNYPATECPDTWEHAHCKQEHVVYLANSSDLKIGITRTSQIPTRWIDQGASQAIPLFKVSNRFQSGLIEVLFKQFVADKTNWRKLLTNSLQTLNMVTVKEELLNKAREKLNELNLAHAIQPLDDEDVAFTYPVLEYPQKIQAISLDKTPDVSGRLLGIKGQYLILDKGVLNIRKHSGYYLSFAY